MSDTRIPIPRSLPVSGPKQMKSVVVPDFQNHRTRTRTSTTPIPVLSFIISTILVLALTTLPTVSAVVYNPTYLLYQPPGHAVELLDSDSDSSSSDSYDDGIAYLFLPDTRGSYDLYGVNVTGDLHSGSVSSHWITLSDSLPFLPRGSNYSSFSPSLADDGTLYVFAGHCSPVSSSSSLWKFTLKDNANRGETGSWSLLDSFADNGEETGSFLLGSTAAFSTTLAPDMSEPNIYAWGGMCPLANATASTWQQSALYSNAMIKIFSSRNGDDDEGYSAEVISRKGPIPEAGFTLTSLSPIVAERSGMKTQQANLVVLGGHTAAAFVNMSMAAVWSLPEESWGFVKIYDPQDEDERSSGGELALRKGAEVERRAHAPGMVDPRSGHTAVLSEDGATLIIHGGWVGDLAHPAWPQLALLHVGAGYGGTGDWMWEIPESQPSGPGVYGHGAALLPGNVMMVYGGYNISSTVTPSASTSEEDLKRRDLYTTPATLNTHLQFFNITSRSWSRTYINPIASSSTLDNSDPPPPSTQDTDSDEDALSASLSKKLGLGLGLGLGIIVLLSALLLLFLYLRNRRHNRESRDTNMRSLAQDHRRFLPSDSDNDDIHPRGEKGSPGFFPWSGSGAGTYTGGGDAYARGERSLGYETLRQHYRPQDGWNGTGVPILSHPNPGMRSKSGGGPPRAARGLYTPASAGGDFTLATSGGLGNGSQNIHPIYEADEETFDEKEGLKKEFGIRDSVSSSTDPSTPTSKRFSTASGVGGDPFATPTQTPRRAQHAATVITAPAPVAGGSRTAPPEHGNSGNTWKVVGNRGSIRDPEVEDWFVDVDVADQLLDRMASKRGRASPSHQGKVPTTAAAALALAAEEDARTASNLSDSNGSAMSVGSVGSRFRMFGLGNTHINSSSNNRGKEKEVASHSNSNKGDDERTGSSGSGTASFSTAKSSFPALQAEGPSLLYGSRNAVRATPAVSTGKVSPYQQGNDEYDPDDDDYDITPGSPSKMKPRGWLGSLRRVFSTNATQAASRFAATAATAYSGIASGNNHGATSTTPRSEGERRRKLVGADYDSSGFVSLNPTLLRRKQGKQGWKDVEGDDGGLDYTYPGGEGGMLGDPAYYYDDDVEAHGTQHYNSRLGEASHDSTPRSAVKGGASGSSGGIRFGDGGGNMNALPAPGADDSDWDIERAVEQRLVQVMFTVPKERLRVVNAEIEREEEVVVVDPTPDMEHGDPLGRARARGASVATVGTGSIAAASIAESVDAAEPPVIPLKRNGSLGRKPSTTTAPSNHANKKPSKASIKASSRRPSGGARKSSAESATSKFYTPNTGMTPKRENSHRGDRSKPPQARNGWAGLLDVDIEVVDPDVEIDVEVVGSATPSPKRQPQQEEEEETPRPFGVISTTRSAAAAPATTAAGYVSPKQLLKKAQEFAKLGLGTASPPGPNAVVDSNDPFVTVGSPAHDTANLATNSTGSLALLPPIKSITPLSATLGGVIPATPEPPVHPQPRTQSQAKTQTPIEFSHLAASAATASLGTTLLGSSTAPTGLAPSLLHLTLAGHPSISPPPSSSPTPSPSQFSHSNLLPLSRASTPLRMATPVRLARDLERAGFLDGDREARGSAPHNGPRQLSGSSLGVGGGPPHNHRLSIDFEEASALSEGMSEISGTEAGSIGMGGGRTGRTAEMVWIERIERMDRRERERGREGWVEREEAVRKKATSDDLNRLVVAGDSAGVGAAKKTPSVMTVSPMTVSSVAATTPVVGTAASAVAAGSAVSAGGSGGVGLGLVLPTPPARVAVSTTSPTRNRSSSPTKPMPSADSGITSPQRGLRSVSPVKKIQDEELASPRTPNTPNCGRKRTTRVLEMVESFESLRGANGKGTSRSGSPVGSVGSPGGRSSTKGGA